MSQIWLSKTMGNSAEILDGLKWKKICILKFILHTTQHHIIELVASDLKRGLLIFFVSWMQQNCRNTYFLFIWQIHL